MSNIIDDIQVDFDNIADRAIGSILGTAGLRAENARLERKLLEAREKATELGHLADSYPLNWEAERKGRLVQQDIHYDLLGIKDMRLEDALLKFADEYGLHDCGFGGGHCVGPICQTLIPMAHNLEARLAESGESHDTATEADDLSPDYDGAPGGVADD